MDNNLETAIAAALAGGKAIMDIYCGTDADFEIERKSDNSPLTKADRASDTVIMEMLRETALPVLSEEEVKKPYSERKSWQRMWIVDPLDGTKEFIKRNGEFTVNIALVENGSPVAGVVYAPALEKLYWGDIATGAFRCSVAPSVPADIRRIMESGESIPARTGDRPYTVVASRSHMSPETESYINAIKEKHPEVKTTSIGSSLKICLIAGGEADVYPRFAPTMEWDTAAGHAVARSAGMEIYCTDEKTPLVYNKEDLHNPWFIVKKKK